MTLLQDGFAPIGLGSKLFARKLCCFSALGTRAARLVGHQQRGLQRAAERGGALEAGRQARWEVGRG